MDQNNFCLSKKTSLEHKSGSKFTPRTILDVFSVQNLRYDSVEEKKWPVFCWFEKRCFNIESETKSQSINLLGTISKPIYNMQFASHNIRLPSNYIFLYLLRSYEYRIFEIFDFSKFSAEKLCSTQSLKGTRFTALRHR